MPSTMRQVRVPLGLILFGAVPVAFAIVRAVELASDPVVTPDNARFLAMPAPILLHIYGGVPYVVLGALQFVPALRRRSWHRLAGRLLIPCGLAVGVSGVWMTLRGDLPATDGTLLNAFRLIVGGFTIAAMVLGFLAVRRRDIARHRAWMIRGYAVAAMGTGTQTLFFGLWVGAVGEPGVTTKALLMGAAWAVNLAVAERLIRRRRSTAPRRAGAALLQSAHGSMERG
ncbi:MAG: DUF2306 domain-containing protein [Hamadaea sp.]|nr:DUF2306 domain-containing protein [Hamadaea sp.]